MKVLAAASLTGLLAFFAMVRTTSAQTAPPDSALTASQPVMESGPAYGTPSAGPTIINNDPGQASVGNYFGYTEVDRTFEPIYRVDSRAGSLYGYDGFTAVGEFMPFFFDSNDALLWLEVRGFATYTKPGGGANIGGGWRWYNEDFDRIIGFNIWGDYDAGHQRNYQQMGLGFESLGRYLDIRANGYIPFGKTNNTLGSVVGGPVTFGQNYLLLSRYTTTEAAFTGFDTEAGGPMPLLGKYGLSGYVGFYFFTAANVDNFTGVSGRIQGQINENVTIGAQVTHDRTFDTNAQLQVVLTLPDGGMNRWLRQPRVRDRLTAPVFRNYRVVAHEDIHVTSEKAINPTDNQPYFVVHVDPNLTSGTGTGTYENPYSTLAQFNNLPNGYKSNIDIILVEPNANGTSANLNTGVELLSGQHLLSTSVEHTAFNTLQGPISLPITSTSSALPVLTNGSGGDVVTIATGATGVEVSGFTITGSSTGNGIRGINNSAISINQNVIQGGVNGVFLSNLSGTGSLASTFSDNQFTANRGHGLFVDNNATAPLDVFLTGNTATNNGTSVANSQADGFRFGSAGGSDIKGLASGNIATGNTGNGLNLVANGGSVDFADPIGGTDTVAGTDSDETNNGNNFSSNLLSGINVFATNNSTVSVTLINNQLTSNRLDGFTYLADSGTNTVTVGGASSSEGNVFTTNFRDGAHIVGTGTAVFTDPLLIENNRFTSQGRNGIFVDAAGSSVMSNLQIVSNVATGNGTGTGSFTNTSGTRGSGIVVMRQDSGDLTATIDSNQSNNNLGHGLEVVTTGNLLPATTVAITDNTFTGNSLDGMFISGGNQLVITPTGNTVTGNNQAGAEFQSSGNGIVTIVSNNETFTGSTGDVLRLSALGNGILNATFNNVTVEGNPSSSSINNGIYLYGAEHGTLNVNIGGTTGSLIENNTGSGIAANIAENSQLNLNVTNTLIQNNGQDGIHLARDYPFLNNASTGDAALGGASLVIATITNSRIINNQDDGIEFISSGANPSDINQPSPGTANQLSLNNVELSNNGFTRGTTTPSNAPNGGNGLEVNTYADSVLVVRATNSLFSDNATDGVRVFSGDSSSFGQNTGTRSIFDGVTITDNGSNGMTLFSMGNNAKKPTMYVDINANDGNTQISDNGRAGIEATVPNGFLDLVVQGDMVGTANFTTKIQRNATNGIEYNVAGIARDGGDDALLAYQFRNQGSINLRVPDPFIAQGTVTLDNVVVGDENGNDAFFNGNSGNGIQVYNGNSDLLGASLTTALTAGGLTNVNVSYLTHLSGEATLNINQSIISGNSKNGIALDSEGEHSYGGFVLSPQGNLVNLTVTNSQLARNGLAGADLQINGLHGQTAFDPFFRGGGYSRISENQINFTNNNIERNGTYGVFLQANAGEMLRYDFTQEGPVVYPSNFWGVTFRDPGVAPGDGTVFNPDAIGAAGWPMFNAGYLSGIALSSYLNIATDNNTAFQFYQNKVQFNGTPETVTGDGLYIRVSTNSYVSADIGGAVGSGNGNYFSGNVGADVKLSSFIATDANGNEIQPDPAQSQPGDDTADPPVPDHILLDDTAQLDLRFNNNTGRNLDTLFVVRTGGDVGTAGRDSAIYDLEDPRKGGGRRAVQMFQLDNGANVDANNNWAVGNGNGTAQTLQQIFSNNGNFYLAPLDANFPDSAFPYNYTEKPANPFLP